VKVTCHSVIGICARLCLTVFSMCAVQGQCLSKHERKAKSHVSDTVLTLTVCSHIRQHVHAQRSQLLHVRVIHHTVHIHMKMCAHALKSVCTSILQHAAGPMVTYPWRRYMYVHDCDGQQRQAHLAPGNVARVASVTPHALDFKQPPSKQAKKDKSTGDGAQQKQVIKAGHWNHTKPDTSSRVDAPLSWQVASRLVCTCQEASCLFVQKLPSPVVQSVRAIHAHVCW
jgi:hypothetical protein